MNGVKIKVVSANKDGKIELTKMELENLLNEAYRDGYSDGISNYYTYAGISTSTTTPYYEYNTISTSGATLAKSATEKVATIDTTIASNSNDCAIEAVKVEGTKYVVQ